MSHKLGYWGVVPFLLALIYSLYPTTTAIPASLPFIAYSAMIVSFLAGNLWQSGKASNKQLMISNLFSLLAFIALVLAVKQALLLLTLSYWLLYHYERNQAKTLNATRAPDVAAYLTLRQRLTIVVIAIHITAYYLSVIEIL